MVSLGVKGEGRRWMTACILTALAIADRSWVPVDAAPPPTAPLMVRLPLPPGSARPDPPAVMRSPAADESSRAVLDAATRDAWTRYLRVWQRHHADPDDAGVRGYLGLPLRDGAVSTPRRSTAAPRSLLWPAGSYRQLDTPHFQIFSRGPDEETVGLATELEDCYWAWTQLFFPLWEMRDAVAVTLDDLRDDQDVGEYLQQSRPRLATRRKMKVVLFADADEYQRSLSRSVPGIERSTGFYGDTVRITFLYAHGDDDAATRRHELTHQLFREATRSGLGRDRPGATSDFWLVEGIAGYMESLRMDRGWAAVGQWHCSRLQFARYRILGGGEFRPLGELRDVGITQAQSLGDLAAWYAHAIAHTHLLIDANAAADRGWVITRLAELYRIELPPAAAAQQPTPPPSPTAAQMRAFLAVDDRVLQSGDVPDDLRELCLATCPVTPAGLMSLPPQRSLRWLDLSQVAVAAGDVVRLVPDPAGLRQLSLDRTGPGLAEGDEVLRQWLGRARGLSELDLSWVAIDDRWASTLAVLRDLDTLWLTGTQVGDAVLEVCQGLPRLRALDVQRTNVTEVGRERLQRLRPDIRLDPLRLTD